ncbi:helix-turn-helix transcriptional regulator [Clostridium sp. D33t1_170424_F3]|uniref:helix-turn-helix domain-containing protein n=1 Tax=Clostridium sp. D33t1_170424_F3 TaxID=2787099 RepID=UPI0018A8FCC7|nr:helix-turn-helix transcriptional regulator [Clostridium sp. D33t1_170424_F3]
MLTDKKLCEKLRALRENNGFKQLEIAKILNCSRSTYTYYETGKTTPSIAVLKTLAKVYNVSLLELLADEKESGELRDVNRPDSFDHIKYIYDLSPNERMLVGIFRAASPKEREQILAYSKGVVGIKK